MRQGPRQTHNLGNIPSLETNPEGGCHSRLHFTDVQWQLRDPAWLILGLRVQVAAQGLNQGLTHSTNGG